MERPTVCFFEVLRDLLAQGKVRLEVREGIGQVGGEESGAELLGWYDDNYVYLLPGAAYNRVARFLRDEGLHFPVKVNTLRKHLFEEGYLMRGADDRYRGRNGPVAGHLAQSSSSVGGRFTGSTVGATGASEVAGLLHICFILRSYFEEK